jgi:hypothetical protein
MTFRGWVLSLSFQGPSMVQQHRGNKGLLLFFFKVGPCCIAQGGLKLLILLPQPPEC